MHMHGGHLARVGKVVTARPNCRYDADVYLHGAFPTGRLALGEKLPELFPGLLVSVVTNPLLPGGSLDVLRAKQRCTF